MRDRCRDRIPRNGGATRNTWAYRQHGTISISNTHWTSSRCFSAANSRGAKALSTMLMIMIMFIVITSTRLANLKTRNRAG